jgi:DNA adenine methylase
VKWAGGKSRLLSQLLPLLPSEAAYMRHLEPFAGGATMFFARRPGRAVLGDKNPHLCATYAAVRDAVEDVIALLRELAQSHSVGRYYELRERYNQRAELADAERAALFIYLNKTCFNGLHRVNRRGDFNVPAGRYTSPRILDEVSLRAASRELQRVELCCEDFESMLGRAQAGDFIYLDPPYVPVTATARFTAYAAGGFTLDDQRRLRDVVDELDRRGCAVMVSNSDAAEVRELYRGYVIDTVSTRRSISCGRRASVTELVVRNYGGRRALQSTVAARGAEQLEAFARARTELRDRRTG